MYLVDTNVVSELRKGARSDAGVQAFFDSVADTDLFLSVLTIGEIRRGADLVRWRGDINGAGRLEAWLDQLCEAFASRILPFDTDCAMIWGRLMAPDKAHPIDKQIAATAHLYDLTIVTRNVKDFGSTGVRFKNPFQG